MKVTIIVPCYNGNRFIESFFRCFSKAVIPNKVDFELYLVDNGSSDNSIQLINEYSSLLSNEINFYSVSFLDSKGSYAARNYVVRHSQSEFIAFTDIDCRVPLNFLQRIEHIVLSYQRGLACAGCVKLCLSDRPNLYEYYDFIFGFNMKSYVSQRTGVTACAVFDRQNFEEAGGFDGVESGGDRMFFKRLLENEAVQYVYEPSLFVYHPCRDSYGELINKKQRVARGLVHYSKNSSSQRFYFVLKNLLGAVFQIHQFKTIIKKRKIVFKDGPISGIYLTCFIFWLGFYARAYTVIVSLQEP